MCSAIWANLEDVMPSKVSQSQKDLCDSEVGDWQAQGWAAAPGLLLGWDTHPLGILVGSRSDTCAEKALSSAEGQRRQKMPAGVYLGWEISTYTRTKDGDDWSGEKNHENCPYVSNLSRPYRAKLTQSSSACTLLLINVSIFFTILVFWLKSFFPLFTAGINSIYMRYLE